MPAVTPARCAYRDRRGIAAGAGK